MAKSILVHDKFRTNNLSIQPGGSTVTVEYADGSNRSYNKVKNPTAYINSIIKDETISSVLVDGQPYWAR
jgi:hypothetical protein